MITAVMFKSATSDELSKAIDNLIAESGMTWEQLEASAEAFALSDDNLARYRTIKSMKWISLGE